MEALAAKEIKQVFDELLEADVIGIDEGQFVRIQTYDSLSINDFIVP